MFYLGLLIVEIVVAIIDAMSGQVLSGMLLTLIIVTTLSFILFLLEGIVAYRKLMPRR